MSAETRHLRTVVAQVIQDAQHQASDAARGRTQYLCRAKRCEAAAGPAVDERLQVRWKIPKRKELRQDLLRRR